VRVYLAACLAIVVICIGGYFALNTIQEPTGIAYATDGTRISPHWAWRSVVGPSGQSEEPATKEESVTKVATVEECNRRKAWQWIFVDFGRPEGEPTICTDSQ
jgi:hypothetical protein